MKSIKLLALLAIVVAFVSCDALKQATNTTTTGAVFSLNGKWQLISTGTQGGGLVNSIVTVSPLVSEGRLTTLSNNSQCYRQDDIKWKSIKSNNAGGYNISNLLSNCSSGALTYVPAVITVVNNNEIRLTGQNVSGQQAVESWTRLQ